MDLRLGVPCQAKAQWRRGEGWSMRPGTRKLASAANAGRVHASLHPAACAMNPTAQHPAVCAGQAQARRAEAQEAELLGVTWHPQISKLARDLKRGESDPSPWLRLTQAKTNKTQVRPHAPSLPWQAYQNRPVQERLQVIERGKEARS